jgi:hypothetical protein
MASEGPRCGKTCRLRYFAAAHRERIDKLHSGNLIRLEGIVDLLERPPYFGDLGEGTGRDWHVRGLPLAIATQTNDEREWLFAQGARLLLPIWKTCIMPVPVAESLLL